MSEMTDQEINIKIAEACPDLVTIVNDGWVIWKNGSKFNDADTVCFCNDLNAMHVVEDDMNRPMLFLKMLDEMCEEYNQDTSHETSHPDWFLVHATARQRAEAFLATIKTNE